MTYAKHLLAASALASIALVASPALAAGVDAGTLIENTATATYSSNGTPQSIDSNTVTVLVDEILDVAIASNDAGAVTATGSAVLTFTVTNVGNGPEAFRLTANPAIPGNDFDAAIAGIALDTNGNGVYDAGIDTLLANGSNGSVLSADGDELVFVILNTPAGVADGDTSQVRLRADAVTGTGAPGTVFANQGVGGGDAVVGATGANDFAQGSLIASVSAVSLNKSATIADPFGGSQAVPGAVVTFTIVASVTGSGSVANLVVSDAIPAGTTYAAGTLELDGAPLTDAADGDAGAFAANAISVSAGTVAAGANRTVTFDVTIDRN